MRMSVKELNKRLSFTGLEKKLEKRLGIKVKLEGHATKKSNGYGYGLKFRSQNLKKHAGIMGDMYEELVINQFTNGINKDKDGVVMGCVNVHFRWDYKVGGSNGHELFWAYYNFETKKWSFSE